MKNNKVNKFLFSILSIITLSGALQAEEVCPSEASPLFKKALKLSRPLKDLEITSADLRQLEDILFESLTAQGPTESEQKQVIAALHKDLDLASTLVNNFMFGFIWPTSRDLVKKSRHFKNVKLALNEGNRELAQTALLALIIELNLCSSLESCDLIKTRLSNTDL